MTTLGQPKEASCPLGAVIPAEGVVVVDVVAMTDAPASQLRKKLMPVLILKPRDMIPDSTNS